MPLEPLFPVRDAWQTITLDEAARLGGGDVLTGPFGSELHKADYVEQGIPTIMPSNIGDNRVNAEGIARITPEDRFRLSRYILRKGDIVYSRRGDVERRALIRDEEDGWLCGTGSMRIRFGEGHVDSRYASYYLGHPAVRSWIVRHAIGATMPNLSKSILGALPFVLPPLPTQRRIAHILGTLDDKIELNRRMNATLEALARALFKAWFVDFAPVRAKAAGRDPGLPAPLAALFPAALTDSPLGPVPEGWGVQPLDSIANYLNGLALQKYPADGDDFLPVIKIAQLRQGSTQGADRASRQVPAAYVVHDGDVLFSWSGSLEVEVWCGGEGALNQHLFKVGSETHPKWFYYHWTREHLAWFRSIAADKATTMGHIQRKHLNDALVVVPPPETVAHLGEFLAPLLERRIVNTVQSRTLAALRDTLLPRLMAGDIDVTTGGHKLEERQDFGDLL